jgi:hypothetical protein
MTRKMTRSIRETHMVSPRLELAVFLGALVPTQHFVQMSVYLSLPVSTNTSYQIFRRQEVLLTIARSLESLRYLRKHFTGKFLLDCFLL